MRTTTMPSHRHVVILASFRFEIVHEVARAVYEYSIHCGDWTVILIDAGEMHWIRQVPKMDGMIAACNTEPVISAARRARCPVVNVSCRFKLDIPTVTYDNHAIGRLAAQHLLDRGLRSFLAVGSDANFSELRTQGFIQRLREAGFDSDLLTTSMDKAVLHARRAVKPLGVFIVTDYFAREFVIAAEAAGLHVGHDIALIGVDNERLICETCRPHLSSIDTQPATVGRKAAELLHTLMQGTTPPTEPILVEPGRVVVRRSSEFFAYEDPAIGAALRMISEEACNGLRVDHIADRLKVSRRWLEKRFKEQRGCTLYDEIREARFHRARELLIYTDLPVYEIALKVGCRDTKRFSTLFRQRMGLPPSEFRRCGNLFPKIMQP